MSAVYNPSAPTTSGSATGATPLSGAQALNTQTLSAALAATPGASAWEVEVLSDEQTQLYVIGDAVESRRNVVNQRAQATIYNLHAPHTPGADGLDGAQQSAQQAMGRAELSLLGEDAANPDRLAARLSDGVTMASLTDNPPFALPAPSEYAYPMPPLVDPVLLRDAAGALDRARVLLEVAVAAQPNVSLSSAEFYATRRQRSFRNSQGVRGSYQETEVFLDLVLIATDRGRSAETHCELKRRRLEDLQIEGTVAAYATFARHSLYATTPQTARGPVILSGEALANFFSPLFFVGNPLLMQTSAQATYQHLNRFNLGDYITGEEPRGDRLNLTSDPLRPYGVRSYRFDADGLPATETPLIENGVLRRQWADARYAAYLGVAPTGQVGNLAVGRGLSSLDALRTLDGGPVYEIVAFSAFSPDPMTGEFSAEIRLGYRHDASGVRPIKGGALTGNVFTALQDVRFSATAYTDGVYYGPAAARFADLTVSGA